MKEEVGELREEKLMGGLMLAGLVAQLFSSFPPENCKKPAAPLSNLNSSFLSILFCSSSSLLGEIRGSKGDSPLWEKRVLRRDDEKKSLKQINKKGEKNT